MVAALPGILSPISDRSLRRVIEDAFPSGSEVRIELEAVFNQMLELTQLLASSETRR